MFPAQLPGRAIERTDAIARRDDNGVAVSGGRNDRGRRQCGAPPQLAGHGRKTADLAGGAGHAVDARSDDHAVVVAQEADGTPEQRRPPPDLALGRGAREAFSAFGAAGPTEARVAALVTAAGRFGSPLSELLVTQADALRANGRRRAEAQARRLPVLMLFPLAFCILPALLAVFLGPPLLSLLN